MEIFLSILLCIALISIMMLGYFDEKKEWNGGKCPKCGKKWEYLGTDHHGGHEYRCPSCNKHFWITYRKINKNEKRRNS